MECDTCGSEDDFAGVCSLPFAPMSVCYCHRCLNENAHPLWAMQAAIDMCEGDVAEWFKALRSYKDGHYIDYEEIKRDV